MYTTYSPSTTFHIWKSCQHPTCSGSNTYTDPPLQPDFKIAQSEIRLRQQLSICQISNSTSTNSGQSHNCHKLPNMEGASNFDTHPLKCFTAHITPPLHQKCSLLEGINARNHSRGKFLNLLPWSTVSLWKHVPQAQFLHINLPSFGYYLCPMTCGEWGRMWGLHQHLGEFSQDVILSSNTIFICILFV